jgi:flagellin
MDITTLSTAQAAGLSEIAEIYASVSGQLASGERLTDAGAGAAELAIANEVLGDLTESQQGIRNLIDGVSMVQTADGALGVVSDNLVRMKALATQAQSGTLSDEQMKLLGAEMAQLIEMNAQLGAMTEFNGMKLFEAGGAITIAAGQETELTIDTEGIADITGDVMTDAEAVIKSIDAATDAVNAQRGRLGADMMRMENYTQNLEVQAQSLLAAESVIRDIDAAQISASAAARQILSMQVFAANAHNRTVTEAAMLFFGK